MNRMITDDDIVRGLPDEVLPLGGPSDRGADLLQAVAQVLRANDNLRQCLTAYDEVVSACSERLHAGMRIRDIVTGLSPGDATIGSEVAVIEVYEARRTLRQALVSALLSEGMPVDTVAATFDVTVESVCNFANEVGIPFE